MRVEAVRNRVVAVVLALWAPAAQAAHPLLTDDAGTLGRGRRQLEVASELSRDRSRAGGARVRDDAGEGTVTVGAGVLDRLDVTAGVATTWSRVAAEGDHAESTSGLGDVGLELKWRTLDAGGFGLALKPALTLPTGDAERGLGSGRPCYALAVVASQELGSVALHANVAYLREEYAHAEARAANRADRLHVSAAITGRISRALQLVGDVGAETNPDRASRTWPAYALVGVVYSPSARMDLDVGGKAGLTEPEPDLAARFGLTVRF